MDNKEKIWMVARDCVYEQYDPQYIEYYKGTLENIKIIS